VVLAGASQAGAQIEGNGFWKMLERSIEERMGIAVETVDPRQAATLTDRISAAPAFLDALAPLVGLLLRDRRPDGAKV